MAALQLAMRVECWGAPLAAKENSMVAEGQPIECPTLTACHPLPLAFRLTARGSTFLKFLQPVMDVEPLPAVAVPHTHGEETSRRLLYEALPSILAHLLSSI